MKLLKFKHKIFVTITLFFLIINSLNAQFVHPGCLHKKSDLDRMKYMVEAGVEPYISTYNKLKEHSLASYSYVVKGDTSMTVGTDGLISSDGGAAYLNALMWSITGDERHAQKCVEIFNAWVNVTKTSSFALRSGTSCWKMIEAAEIIKSTYSGWKEDEITKFKDMLVYPGYSNTTIPSGDTSFYWNILNGDPGRHGNQDAIAFRAMISMGVFLDNEIMYDRALRYFKGLPHRADDIPYAAGPGVSGTVNSDNPYFTNYKNSNPGTIPDYGFNGVLEYYFWENGQCQESSRDQQHTFFGLSIFQMLAEVAWNQGDDAWNYLDNRLLKAFEFNSKYNISFVQSYPDQLEPWEPTVASGEFIERTDRTGRWKSKSINPYNEGNFESLSRGDFIGKRPIYEQAMAHFEVRMGFSEAQTLWTGRGRELYGIEENGWTVDHAGWGGLSFHRTTGCAGDPISGFDASDLPTYKMNDVSTSMEAENYDYFILDGEGHTYSDSSSNNSGGEYRTDENVDINVCSEGGYAITDIADGEWLTYTIHVPSNGLYNIDINYASVNANGTIQFKFGGEEITSAVSVPHGSSNSTGITDWKNFEVANQVRLKKGVQAMKVLFGGSDNSFELNTINVSLVSEDPDPINLALEHGVASQSTTDYGGVPERAIDGNTNGSYGGNSVTHTEHGPVGGITPKWWQVDLQGNYTIETINIYNRTGSTDYSEKLNSFTVEVIDSNGNVTFTQTYEAYPNPSLIVSTGDVTGQVVRISKTSDYAISLAEVEVYGVDASLSNNEFELENKIRIYPNPVSNSFTVSNCEGAILEIYNSVGERINKIEIQNSTQSVDMHSYLSGVYFVKITNNGLVFNDKIIKK